MNTTSIDVLNIGLIVLSAVAAFFIPFELFLLSYAILGPLHYLTEISWLQQKGFFTKAKYDYLFLLGGGALLLILSFFFYLSAQASATILLVIFFGSLVLATTTNWKIRLSSFVGIVLVAGLASLSTPVILFTALLPTVIHVFFFTLCFMLYGALRGKSNTGLLAVGTYLLALGLLVLVSWFTALPAVSNTIVATYAPFQEFNASLLAIFRTSYDGSLSVIYASTLGVSIMRFLAFVYTYHYLNWFSKTSIIRWHQISPRRLVFIVVAWGFSMTLYRTNYLLGFFVLYVLSYIHVLLEFPLNQNTFIGIYGQIKGRLRPTLAATTVVAK